jgi:hypothetical protein
VVISLPSERPWRAPSKPHDQPVRTTRRDQAGAHSRNEAARLGLIRFGGRFNYAT